MEVVLMSRIVVLVDSMRKGVYTDLLTEAFVEGESKNSRVQMITKIFKTRKTTRKIVDFK